MQDAKPNPVHQPVEAVIIINDTSKFLMTGWSDLPDDAGETEAVLAERDESGDEDYDEVLSRIYVETSGLSPGQKTGCVCESVSVCVRSN